MRISDWSSDVCSSDLVRNGSYNVRTNAAAASAPGVTPVVLANTIPAYDPFFDVETVWSYEIGFKSDLFDRKVRLNGSAYLSDEIGRASCRERVCQYV